MRIVLLAALPDEFRPAGKRLGFQRVPGTEPFRRFRMTRPGIECLLIETGMGGDRALRALAHACAEIRPDLVVSFGFAGGLDERLEVGRLLVGREFLWWDRDGAIHRLQPPPGSPSSHLQAFCRAQRASPARFLSVPRLREKRLLTPYRSKLLASSVDLESGFLVAEARRSEIPAVCLRAVSDELDHEIAIDPDAVSDPEGRPDPARVARLVLARPRLAVPLLRLWRRSMAAARELARGLEAFLDQHPDEISGLAAELGLLEIQVGQTTQP
jgi:nucleoside phosphorylase